MSQNVFGGTSLVLTTLQSLNSIMNTIASGIATLNNNIITISSILSNQLQALIRLDADMRTTKGKDVLSGTTQLDAVSLQAITSLSTNITEVATNFSPTKQMGNIDQLKSLFSGGGSILAGARGGAENAAQFSILNKILPRFFSGKDQSPIITAGQSLLGGVGGGIGGLFKGIGQSMKPMVSQFAAMGPQMLAMSLIIQPIQAFLEGILTPLEPLTELFGAFGEILGTALIPLVNMLMAFLMPMIPVLQGIANLLAPILPILFMMLTPFGQLMAIFQIIGAFMPPDIAAWFTNLPNIIGDTLTNLGTIIQTSLSSIWAVIVDSIGGLGFQIGVAVTKAINDFLHTSYGGADANMFTSV